MSDTFTNDILEECDRLILQAWESRDPAWFKFWTNEKYYVERAFLGYPTKEEIWAEFCRIYKERKLREKEL